MASEQVQKEQETAHELGDGIGEATLFNHAGWFLREIIRVSSHWFAHWPGAYFYVPAPSLFTSGLYHLLLLSVCSGWIRQPKLRAWRIAAPSHSQCLFDCRRDRRGIRLSR
jgi:hypothetical protein